MARLLKLEARAKQRLGQRGADWPRGELALVVAGRPPDASLLALAALQRQFSLTSAETRLALLVGEGLDPGEIANRLAVSITTVRTHLRRVFDKTGTKRQAELVRIIATHPVMAVSVKWPPAEPDAPETGGVE